MTGEGIDFANVFLTYRAYISLIFHTFIHKGYLFFKVLFKKNFFWQNCQCELIFLKVLDNLKLYKLTLK